MSVAWQPSLLDASPSPAFDPAFTGITRHQLDEPAWVDHLPGWVEGSDTIAELLASSPWKQRDMVMYGRVDPIVVTVSLGHRRRFLLRPRGEHAARRRFDAGHADLIVMGGTSQRTWEHTIPKVASASGPRMSVTFRHSVSYESRAADRSGGGQAAGR